MKILLIEDEDVLATWLTRALSQSHFRVERACNGAQAQAFIRASEYDAVILDLRLPDKDGLSILAEMRARDDRTPVLILTAHGALDDRVRGLNMGADDFLTKPFAIAELEARLIALIRRSQGKAAPRLQMGALSFDAASKLCYVSDQPLALTPREHAALVALLKRNGQPISKNQLFNQVFELTSDVQADALDVILHRLRKKLSACNVQVETVRGVGYCLKISPT